MNLADFIKRRRGDLGMSLQAVADASGSSKPGVHSLETGTYIDPHVSTLLGLAKALKVKPEIMFAAAKESLNGKEA